MTGKESFNTIIHWSTFRWVNLKIIWKGGGKGVNSTVKTTIKTTKANFSWSCELLVQADVRAEGQHRWSWSAGTWRGSWQRAARSCSMGACAPVTGSQTSWTKKNDSESSLEEPFHKYWMNVCHHSVEGSEHLGASPVEGVAHFNGDQNRQGHGHGRWSLKNLTLNAGKILIFIMALHEVRLQRRKRWASRICPDVFVYHKWSHYSPAGSRRQQGQSGHTGTTRQHHPQWQHPRILVWRFC